MEDIIVRYLNREASNEEKQRLLVWLKEHEDNRKLFSELQTVWQIADYHTDPADEAQKAFTRFISRVDSYEMSSRTGIQILSAKWMTVAAAIIVLLFAGSFWAGRFKSATPQRMYTVVMSKGCKGSVLLPDSSVVWLNGNSKLTYPEAFARKERSVTLEGEGYFDVARNPNAPFFVQTHGMKIKVLGTRFDVKNYAGSSVIGTSLLSGSVEVELTDTKHLSLLKPNQQLLYNTTDRSFSINEVDASEQILWINDQLELSNEKLSDVLRKLSYWYGLEFIIDQDVDTEQRLSFVVRKESEEELLDILTQISSTRYALKENKVFVTSN